MKTQLHTLPFNVHIVKCSAFILKTYKNGRSGPRAQFHEGKKERLFFTPRYSWPLRGVGNPQLTHCFFCKGNKEWIVEKKMVAIWGTDFWSPPSEFWLAGLKFPASKSRINTLRNTPSRLHCSASDNTNAPHSATMEEPQASHVHYAPEKSSMPRHPTQGWKMAARGESGFNNGNRISRSFKNCISCCFYWIVLRFLGVSGKHLKMQGSPTLKEEDTLLKRKGRRETSPLAMCKASCLYMQSEEMKHS